MTVQITDEQTTVIVTEDVVRIITIGTQGPEGPQGPPGDADMTIYDNHLIDITDVHGIADTTQLATLTDLAGVDASLPTTTTGDLIVHGATEPVRLPVGAEGEALTVVSGIPAWAVVEGGGEAAGPPPIPQWTIGRYYDYRAAIVFTQAVTNKINPSTAHVYFSPIFIPERTRFDRVAVYIGATPGNPTAMAQLCIYACDPAAYRPTTLVADLGELGAGTTGEKSIVINQWLDPGWYFMGIQANNSTNFSMMNGAPVQRVFGNSNAVATTADASYGAFGIPNTYGTFPATISASPLSVADFIIIMLRPAEFA